MWMEEWNTLLWWLLFSSFSGEPHPFLQKYTPGRVCGEQHLEAEGGEGLSLQAQSGIFSSPCLSPPALVECQYKAKSTNLNHNWAKQIAGARGAWLTVQSGSVQKKASPVGQPYWQVWTNSLRSVHGACLVVGSALGLFCLVSLVTEQAFSSSK